MEDLLSQPVGTKYVKAVSPVRWESTTLASEHLIPFPFVVELALTTLAAQAKSEREHTLDITMADKILRKTGFGMVPMNKGYRSYFRARFLFTAFSRANIRKFFVILLAPRANNAFEDAKGCH
jgi:hypothetical protein